MTDLTHDQWSTLLRMIKAQQSISSSKKLFGKLINFWLLDMGDTLYYMDGNFKYLVDICDIIPWPVKLPNGKKTYAMKSMRVCLGPDLRLDNVLYVPQLTCNLIFVS